MQQTLTAEEDYQRCPFHLVLNINANAFEYSPTMMSVFRVPCLRLGDSKLTASRTTSPSFIHSVIYIAPGYLVINRINVRVWISRFHGYVHVVKLVISFTRIINAFLITPPIVVYTYIAIISIF